MIVGVPSETCTDERRVALVPAGVASLSKIGCTVQIESGAGETAGFPDQAFEEAGATIINPGCGACIGCGPGVSETTEQVTVSAINRNFQGRSGPGRLYLASPLTVAASAVAGHIVSYQPGMFGVPAEASAG